MDWRRCWAFSRKVSGKWTSLCVLEQPTSSILSSISFERFPKGRQRRQNSLVFASIPEECESNAPQLRVSGCDSGVHSKHPLVFTVIRLAAHPFPTHTSRSGDHRCCFWICTHRQSKCTPDPRCRLSVDGGDPRSGLHLPNLRGILVVIEGDIPPPSLVLLDFTHLGAVCDEAEGCLGMFRGATPGVLESVNFTSQSEQIGDFLGAFEEVALVASVHITLSGFSMDIGRSWNPVSSAHSFRSNK